ncbi:von Willebrand factor, type A [Methanocorpusculum labreanum Z]|uniref:von Willebrand factor, type A n=1 Tax=Methanocorpusculum labreanum (strain ATCC 43576 / DSM 4855 / Z) TaxID=410358 RepID=A2SS27_METLZ|nr:VWA domain-containing protein [Methanocorpusculum labreanum]ABN07133.1 von Willebrand factor, type A [Methanocorpusculum labreanum Z]
MPSPNNEIPRTKELAINLYFDYFSGLNDKDFENELNKKLTDWEKSTVSYLENTNPLETHRLNLVSAEWDYRAHGGSKKSIISDLDEYKVLQPSVNVKFWEEKIGEVDNQTGERKDESIIENLSLIRRNEQEAWRKEYEKQLLEWQLEEIQNRRKQLLQNLKEWFETIQQMKEVFEALGVDTGVFWDLSVGKLSAQDISVLKKWADYLKYDEKIRELCELMGRLHKEQQSHHTEIINSTIQYHVKKPDVHSNEEIIGIKFGRDLENIIPQELALLSDPEVTLLFDLKYVENRLMCFSKQGYITEIIEENMQETVNVDDEEKMGPIIICVDTSGSMSGAPENIAKALTLSLASRAISQKRNCYLINFSTSINTLDFTPPKGIHDLINFLKMSFHGGTDVAPALYEGIRMMSESDYKKADLLVISDFVIYGLSSDIVPLCKKQKQEENRFFALCIGSFGTQRVEDGVFDQSWTYDPRSGSIAEINNVFEWVTRKS